MLGKTAILTIRHLQAKVVPGMAPCSMPFVHMSNLIKLLENQCFRETAAALRSLVKNIPGHVRKTLRYRVKLLVKQRFRASKKVVQNTL